MATPYRLTYPGGHLPEPFQVPTGSICFEPAAGLVMWVRRANPFFGSIRRHHFISHLAIDLTFELINYKI